MRLLVADDDRDTADTLAALLRDAGHEVAVAYCGIEAIERSQKLNPDVLILDLAMPMLSGIQVAHHLRTRPEFKDKHFIALTGHCEGKYLEAASKAAFNEYLVKPCKFELLRAILDEVASHQPESVRPKKS